jgi:hypothetical protein
MLDMRCAQAHNMAAMLRIEKLMRFTNMNDLYKTEFLGHTLRLLGKYKEMTFARLMYRTRVFRRSRHINNSSAFSTLRDFVELGYIDQDIARSRVVFVAKVITDPNPLVIKDKKTFAEEVKMNPAQAKIVEEVRLNAIRYERTKRGSRLIPSAQEEAAKKQPMQRDDNVEFTQDDLDSLDDDVQSTGENECPTLKNEESELRNMPKD